MVHYLQCTHCGHMNEMKSEYVVFCTSCGQKLENNFTNWQRRNPGGTFDEYKQNACLTENQLPPKLPAKKNKPLKQKILIVAITTLFAVIGSWLGSSALTAIRNSIKTDEKVLSEQWVKKTYGSFGITLETPWELKSSPPPPLQESVQRMIEHFESFESENDNQFKIGINAAKYNPEETRELSLQGGADGAVNGVKNMQGVTNFTYSEDNYSVSGLPAIIQRGSYTQDGIKLGFINVVTAKDFNYWQVMVLRRENDDIAKKAAERIIQSIQIDY